MRSLLDTPIDAMLAHGWSRVDGAHKKGFLVAVCISVLGFGFEMTNLTLHHDDLTHLLVQRPLVGYYLGRFGHAGLFYYGQHGYFLPFLDMTLGMALMGAYGVLVAHFWGARKAIDIALVAGIVCVFPYMAQVYQYNSAMIAYPAAHLLAASAVVLSTRRSVISVAIAAFLYVVTFSIYQAVLANAATIFLLWLLTKVLFTKRDDPYLSTQTLHSTGTALVSVLVGGVVYVAIVASMNIPFDSSQGADKAFSISHRFQNGPALLYAASEVIKGSRSFFLWPESYFPDALKKIQLVLMAGAAIFCLWLPARPLAKLGALILLAVTSLAPRTMQLLHPQANYHNLTLTAYALVIAGAVTITLRSGRTLPRSAAAVLGFLLIAGYVVQCNWISTVNYLNTLAHFSTVNQVLSRVRSAADKHWDGKTIAVVGQYDMRSDFPFKSAVGVATKFMDADHMNALARLMRDEVTFVRADEKLPKILEYAAIHATWPHSASVGVVDGMGVVVFSRK